MSLASGASRLLWSKAPRVECAAPSRTAARSAPERLVPLHSMAAAMPSTTIATAARSWLSAARRSASASRARPPVRFPVRMLASASLSMACARNDQIIGEPLAAIWASSSLLIRAHSAGSPRSQASSAWM